jgi:hypothetical protein
MNNILIMTTLKGTKCYKFIIEFNIDVYKLDELINILEKHLNISKDKIKYKLIKIYDYGVVTRVEYVLGGKEYDDKKYINYLEELTHLPLPIYDGADMIYAFSIERGYYSEYNMFTSEFMAYEVRFPNNVLKKYTIIWAINQTLKGNHPHKDEYLKISEKELKEYDDADKSLRDLTINQTLKDNAPYKEKEIKILENELNQYDDTDKILRYLAINQILKDNDLHKDEKVKPLLKNELK